MIQSPIRGKLGKEKTLKLVFLENGAFEQHEHGVEYSAGVKFRFLWIRSFMPTGELTKADLEKVSQSSTHKTDRTVSDHRAVVLELPRLPDFR